MTGNNLKPEIIEELAKVLCECGNGGEITKVLARLNIKDVLGEGNTKWRRLEQALGDSQQRTGSCCEVLNFIKHFVPPGKFARKPDEFETLLNSINVFLSFAGYEYLATGEIRRIEPVKTPNEAESRYSTVMSKLNGRNIHEQVLQYCRADLMQEDYFDAVFEASKGLMQRIREMSGVDADGTRLMQQVFHGRQPILAFNTLRTELEQGDQKGFATLLEGCIGAVRNRLAHEPKILWEGADDAADYLTLISLLHRKLDQSVPTNLNQIGS